MPIYTSRSVKNVRQGQEHEVFLYLSSGKFLISHYQLNIEHIDLGSYWLSTKLRPS